MPWVRFNAAFNFRVKPHVTFSYRAGGEYLVKQACAEQAIKVGKAEPIERKQVTDHGKRAGR